MAHTVKRIARGPSAKVNAYAAQVGELVMDTTTNDLVLGTGVAGGVRMAKAGTSISAANGLSVTAGGTLGEATTISGVDATTSAKGVVQLSNSTVGTSQTTAATEKAVADALQAAKDYADSHGGSTYTATAPIDITGTVISISAASTSASGAVQLSNSTTGTSQTTAATEKAVADALTAAKDYTDSHSGGSYSGTAPISVSGSTISISAASTSASGAVQLSNSTTGTSQTYAATEKAVADALTAAKTYANGVVKTYSGSSPISVSGTTISIASASTSASGAVRLSNSTTGTSQTYAATEKAVADALTAAKTYADNADAHASKPSTRTASLSVPSANGTVTATSDGYIYFTASSSGTTDFHYISLKGRVGSRNSLPAAMSGVMHAFIPVSKGEVVTVNYGATTSRSLTFVYANGAS